MKKILVIGGRGFIGHNLCKKLKEANSFQISSLDNESRSINEDMIEEVKYFKDSSARIDSIIHEVPDLIFHLGEYSRVEQSFNDIEEVWQSNVIGTYNVLDYCVKNKVKLIYAGSSTKFADDGKGEMSSPYAWTKAKNTELVKCFSEWFGLDYAITYFYNAFGPTEPSDGPYSTVVAKFKKMMSQNQKLTVVKPGSQKRNFTHIDDIVSGLMLVGQSGNGDGYEIGNNNSYTILELAEMFGGEIEMLPERQGNRMSGEVNNDKIKSLGWSCKTELPDYINLLKENNWDDSC